MSRVTADMTITLDGYGSGRGQSRERPFGDIDPDRLHAWMFDHREGNVEEVERIVEAGSFVMGRKMFSSDEGEWDLEWHGWWGKNPPYHAPTFVLCHRPRPSIEMEGGTVFHFVTEGIDAALARARKAAGEKSVSIAGGVSVLNQCLAAGLVDELRLHVVPFVAGGGERLFADAAGVELVPVSSRTTPHVTHLVYERT
ncbi:MAG: dihydrofolate reductase family protein [Solirubrobacterales bacterium]|nr:dihydrofolate reductase family protein [Solirubrobacterales bacterium]